MHRLDSERARGRHNSLPSSVHPLELLAAAAVARLPLLLGRARQAGAALNPALVELVRHSNKGQIAPAGSLVELAAKEGAPGLAEVDAPVRKGQLRIGADKQDRSRNGEEPQHGVEMAGPVGRVEFVACGSVSRAAGLIRRQPRVLK